VIAQVAAIVAIVVCGIAGPRWPDAVDAVCVAVGIVTAAAGVALLVAGIGALGSALTPFPKPLDRSNLREGGAYGLVRHPIYGGLFLLGLGWTLSSSPLALVPTATLAVVFEFKARVEESMLDERFPEYAAYRTRVRWRFIPRIR
jgi:protein-S-isoprenylcysteine O-methyltransferase Ste14